MTGTPIGSQLSTNPKPILGYALERNTRISPTQTVVDVGSLAMGKLMQPGEERTFYMFGGFRSVSLSGKSVSPLGNEEEEFNYELMAMLFADGTFYGPDSMLLEFSSMISNVKERSTPLRR